MQNKPEMISIPPIKEEANPNGLASEKLFNTPIKITKSN
jgi:hypothetical protein